MSVTRTGTVRTWAFARRLSQHHQHHEDWTGPASSASQGLAQFEPGRLQGVWGQHHERHQDWHSANLGLQGVWASIMNITRTGTVRMQGVSDGIMNITRTGLGGCKACGPAS